MKLIFIPWNSQSRRHRLTLLWYTHCAPQETKFRRPVHKLRHQPPHSGSKMNWWDPSRSMVQTQLSWTSPTYQSRPERNVCYRLRRVWNPIDSRTLQAWKQLLNSNSRKRTWTHLFPLKQNCTTKLFIIKKLLRGRLNPSTHHTRDIFDQTQIKNVIKVGLLKFWAKIIGDHLTTGKYFWAH